MPGKKKELDPTLPNVIQIEGDTWELEELRGLKSHVLVPKVINLGVRLVHGASQANLDLTALLGEDGFNWGALQTDSLLAVAYICDVLVTNWASLSEEILPFLLNKNPVWLGKHGTFAEMLSALWKALNFHAPSIFGESSWEALKKLGAEAPEEEAEESTSSEPNET